LTKFNLNNHTSAIDSMGTIVCWRPLGSWDPRLKPI